MPSGPVSLSLAKISYCTTTTPCVRSNKPWTHIPDQDGAFAVFDTVRQRNLDGSVVEKRVLKLISGSNYMEQIDLDTLRYQATLDQQLSATQKLSDEKLRLIVIVKKPFLALRYQLPDHQTRRIQLNFRPESGFDYAANTLRSIGLPVRDRSEFDPTTSRPSSTQAGDPAKIQQSSRERLRVFAGSQGCQLSSSQPTPIPIHASSGPPSSSQYGSMASGVDLDGLRPFLSTSIHDMLNGSIRPADGLVLQPPTSSPDALEMYVPRTEYSHAPKYLAESPGFDWQSNPYGMNPQRPATAPLTQPGRQAPDTTRLSQMLPPDRSLPFPTRSEKVLSCTFERPKVSQQRPESSPSTTSKIKLKSERRSATKADPKFQNPGKSALVSNPLRSIRATTPYNLRPTSSSSNLGSSKPPTYNVTSVVHSAIPSPGAKLAESRAKLVKEGWALTDAEFIDHFNEDAFGSIKFLGELLKFAKVQGNFTAAYPLLLAARQSRRDQNRRQYREWVLTDVKNAMSAFQQSELDIRAAKFPLRKANTPRKRTRPVSPVLEEIREDLEDIAAQDPEIVETPAPPHSVPGYNPITPIASRKRPASALEEIPRNSQPESPDSRTVRPRLPEPPAADTPTNTQIEPATSTQPGPEKTNQDSTPIEPTPQTEPTSTTTNSQSTSSTPITQHPTPPPPLNNSTISLSTLRAEMLSTLDNWAQKTTTDSSIPPKAAHQTSKELLAEWAALDEERKVKSLEDMISDCLEDENFHPLIRLLEGAWMRVGLF